MPPKDTGPFKHGEKVLVPHTDKHWEAKVCEELKLFESCKEEVHHPEILKNR